MSAHPLEAGIHGHTEMQGKSWISCVPTSTAHALSGAADAAFYALAHAGIRARSLRKGKPVGAGPLKCWWAERRIGSSHTAA